MFHKLIFNNVLNFIKNPEIYKFFLVGLVGAIIVLVFTFVITTTTGIHYVLSTIISFELSMIWGFFANDRWTFSVIKKTSKAYIRFIKYNSFSVMGLGIIQITMITLTTYFGMHYSTSQLLGIIIAFLFNFMVSKKISFKN